MTQEEPSSLKLDLSDLNQGLPAITPAFGKTLAEAAAICLVDQEHLPGVELKVEGEFNATFHLWWPEVTIKCTDAGMTKTIPLSKLPMGLP